METKSNYDRQETYKKAALRESYPSYKEDLCNQELLIFVYCRISSTYFYEVMKMMKNKNIFDF